MDTFSGLYDKLMKINWDYKSSLYESYYDYSEVVNIERNPSISIIIISWRKHPDTLVNLKILEQLRLEQSLEIIFVDNGGTPGEFESFKSYVNTYIRLSQNTGAYLARNIGAAFANAPVLLFLEDDGIPDIDIVRAHLTVHENYEAISVRGVYLCKTDNPLNERQTVYYWGQRSFPAFANLEGNASYKADLFYQVGGWDDKIVYGHGGLELAIRLLDIEPDKRKQIYSPLPVIYHDLVDNEEQFLKKRKQHVIAFEYLKNKHPNVEQHREEWQALFLEEGALLPKGTEEQRNAMLQLQARIANRNQEKVNMMNRLFIPSYDDDLLKQTVNELIVGKKCKVFGAGFLGEHIIKTLRKHGIEPVCFLDNDSKKWGTRFVGLEVQSPDSLTTNDFIIIASIYSYEIAEQLQNKGLHKNRDFIIMK
ncbi:glycosyltransferase [Paenibacillus timonensis]|uniref:Glycosyltransferase n=1 Tax=Paenibacillus timonensis TaxID=225915 RepID=A0ABW3S9V9_9BACL|nr:glycosyltransferase [Paenibacillus timonensis]MCH1640495.1 glycosyltransferase [Paenibacillus timonensis]